MERIKRIATQIEECKKFIDMQQDTHYRLAVLLLDNLVELLMYHVVNNEYQYDDWYKQLYKTIENTPTSEEEKQKIISKINLKVIQSKQRGTINKYFDEKLKFLSSDRSYIPVQTARVLSRLHLYRNEIYHRDKVRPESIRTVALLLFDISCDLISDLKLSSLSYSSGDDITWMSIYSEIKMDFGIQNKIAKYYRDSFNLDLVRIKKSLIEHLNDRFKQFNENLLFINENSPNQRDSLDITLKVVQFWFADRTRNPHSRDADFQKFNPKYNLDFINNLRNRIQFIMQSMNKIEMFEIFADIEESLEPIEAQVIEVKSAIEEAIQMAIDIARGK